MKNLPHEIIIELYKNYYSENPRIVLNELFNHFASAYSDKLKAIQIRDLLNSLEKKSYLKWNISLKMTGTDSYIVDDGFKTAFKEDFASDGKYSKTDLKNTHILGILTPEGLDYAIDIDRKRVQHRNNNITIVLSIFTVILTATSLYKTIISQREQEQKLQKLQTQVQLLDSNMKTPQTSASYRDSATSSLSKK